MIKMKQVVQYCCLLALGFLSLINGSEHPHTYINENSLPLRHLNFKAKGGMKNMTDNVILHGKESHSVDNDDYSDITNNDNESADEDRRANTENEKRWVMGDIFGGGYSRFHALKPNARSKRFIHYFSNAAGGRGFTMGKRQPRFNKHHNIVFEYPIKAFHAENTNEFGNDNGGEESREKDYNYDIVQRHHMPGKRILSLRDQDFALYKGLYGSILGRGYVLGKRRLPTNLEFDHFSDGQFIDKNIEHQSQTHEEHDDHSKHNENINALSHDIFIKPFSDSQDESDKYIDNSPDSGAINHQSEEFDLGRALKFGEMLSYTGGPYDKGISFGKHEHGSGQNDYLDENADPYLSKRARYLLGRGTTRGNNKRHGLLLGRGFKLGKRSKNYKEYSESEDSDDDDLDLDLYFAKDDETMFNRKDEIPYNRNVPPLPLWKATNDIFGKHYPGNRNEHVTGRRIGIGRRSYSGRRFGHVLGHGRTFGK